MVRCHAATPLESLPNSQVGEICSDRKPTIQITKDSWLKPLPVPTPLRRWGELLAANHLSETCCSLVRYPNAAPGREYALEWRNHRWEAVLSTL